MLFIGGRLIFYEQFFNWIFVIYWSLIQIYNTFIVILMEKLTLMVNR